MGGYEGLLGKYVTAEIGIGRDGSEWRERQWRILS